MNNDNYHSDDSALMLESMTQSILITTTDLDAPGPFITYVNRAFEKMTGWSREEVIGKSPRLFQGPKTDLEIFSDLREKLNKGEIWKGRTINYKKAKCDIVIFAPKKEKAVLIYFFTIFFFGLCGINESQGSISSTT